MAKNPNSYIIAGTELKRLRKEKGFTLEELAERAEISTSYLSHIERGTRQAPLATLENIAQILGVNFYDLFAPSSAVSTQEKPSSYDAKIKTDRTKLLDSPADGMLAGA